MTAAEGTTEPYPSRAGIDGAPMPTLTAYYANEEERVQYVQKMFERAAPTYDRMERVLSFGSGSRYRQHFLASDVAERASLERGAAGGDWFRTGATFHAWQAVGTSPPDTVPVCRFFGTPGSGPSEHVFTADAAECAALKGNSRWTYEGDAFRVRPLSNSGCPAGNVAIVRYWKPGSTVTESRHRYLLASDMTTVITGWIQEGPVFCVQP